MKYVKSFDKLYEISDTEQMLTKKTKLPGNIAITMESILKSFFALFMDINTIKQIWKAAKYEKGLLSTSFDIYNHLVDVGNILELPENMQLKYATNLGIEITEEDNILKEIIKQLYIQNYKRDFEIDLKDIIKYLEDESNFESIAPVHNIFLEKIKEIQEKIL